ncbi:hypothetical protein CRYUN_Cryun06bG0079500 [Craigia yunnanensis]
MGGIGVVIRNGDGAVMGAYAGRRLGLVYPFTVEASATICSIILAQQMGFYNVEIEGDALGVIKKIQGKEVDMSPIGTLIEEARVRKRSFQFNKFTYIGRLGNMVAHMLAKHGLELEEYSFGWKIVLIL